MKQNEDSVIKFSIANGMIFGSPPGVLTNLNDVELSLITLTRVRSHIFSYVAGQAKAISGWHSLFQNDVDTINGVTNFFVNEMKRNNGEEDDENNDSSISPATIAVILAGPMTSDQKAMIQSKTNV